MTEIFPMSFRLKTGSKAMLGFIIAFLVIFIIACIYVLMYEIGEIREVFIFSGIIIFMLSLLGYFIWSGLYEPSALKFYEDHLTGESVLGQPTVIYYTDIETIDRTIQFGGAFKLKTENKSLELSPHYKNHEKMYEILENRIRPVFEKKYMEKLEKDHTFICQNAALPKIIIWVLILVSVVLVSLCIYELSDRNEFGERVLCYLGLALFGGGGLLMLKFAKIIDTQYLLNMNGFEVKSRFSSRKYQWEQFTDIEYRFAGDEKGNILSIILETADQEKIGIGATINNFGIFCTIAKTKIRYDEL
ncbi:hypothetical protein QUF72_06600 [Desulfobacterales bacterium HSG2]|nr:hypothetical protein [Desulfobacterales bacterium HSG2]